METVESRLQELEQEMSVYSFSVRAALIAIVGFLARRGLSQDALYAEAATLINAGVDEMVQAGAVDGGDPELLRQKAHAFARTVFLQGG